MLVFVTNFFLNPTIVRSYMAASEMTWFCERCVWCCEECFTLYPYSFLKTYGIFLFRLWTEQRGGKKDKSPVHAKQIACLICIWLIGHGP